ncbi:MAG: hypothetical protein KGI27_04570 [Thaumarchaeota archaeon]|nr:hypothetical protein [Nitrososphaerota archaeon]
MNTALSAFSGQQEDVLKMVSVASFNYPQRQEKMLEIKDILYQAISEYQEKRILSDIAQGESTDAINAIFSHCVSHLDKIDGSRQSVLGSLAEGLTHYLLTLAMIPSQRKTSFQSVDIDVAIPDARTLSTSPEEVVIMYFPKTDELQTINENLDRLRKIQPKSDNIWLVADRPIPVDAKVYTLDREQFSFARIINDLVSFTAGKKQSKLKIFRI